MFIIFYFLLLWNIKKKHLCSVVKIAFIHNDNPYTIDREQLLNEVLRLHHLNRRKKNTYTNHL